MKRIALSLVLIAAFTARALAADADFDALPRAAQLRIDALVADAIAHENLPGGQLVIAYASRNGTPSKFVPLSLCVAENVPLGLFLTARAILVRHEFLVRGLSSHRF